MDRPRQGDSSADTWRDRLNVGQLGLLCRNMRGGVDHNNNTKNKTYMLNLIKNYIMNKTGVLKKMIVVFNLCIASFMADIDEQTLTIFEHNINHMVIFPACKMIVIFLLL